MSRRSSRSGEVKPMRYRILVGLTYKANGDGDVVRAEPGEVRDDLPPHGTGRCTTDCQGKVGQGANQKHAWILTQRLVEEVDESGNSDAEPAPAEE